MDQKSKDWLIVGGLVIMSLAPIFGGVIRISHISAGESNSENFRFMQSPLPAVLHIFCASIFSLLGTIQFSPRLRFMWPGWHRKSGRVLLVMGIFVAATGLWMTMTYPNANHDGNGVYFVRLIVGISMLVFIFFGITSIQKRNFIEHGQWMIRSYALAMGAGTQVLTHLPWLLFPSIQGELSRFFAMTSGWVINIIVAEWIIRNSIEKKRQQHEL